MAEPVDADRARRGARQVDDTAANEGSAIVDAHDNSVAVVRVGDAHARAERQRTVCSGQGVLIVTLTACRLAAMELAAIPRRDARLTAAVAGSLVPLVCLANNKVDENILNKVSFSF